MGLFKYGFVGGIAAIADMSALYIWSMLFGLHYLTGTVIGFIVGLIVNYIISSHFVFRKKRECKKRLEFMGHAAVGCIGLILSVMLMKMAVDYMRLPIMVSKCTVIIIVFFWNYYGRKYLYRKDFIYGQNQSAT